jgi:Tetracyclin repressor-like, C-terminal domain
LLRVWCSDDNAVLRQKLRPGIADRIAPLLADIIGQGVQEGVFTVAYPDQMGRVIVALIQDLNDRLAELVLTAESGPRTLRTVEHTMIVLIAFCLQGLVKFAVWFLVGCDRDDVFPGGHGDGSDAVGWGGVALPERPGVAPGVADGECSWAVGLVDRWIDVDVGRLLDPVVLGLDIVDVDDEQGIVKMCRGLAAADAHHGGTGVDVSLADSP